MSRCDSGCCSAGVSCEQEDSSSSTAARSSGKDSLGLNREAVVQMGPEQSITCILVLAAGKPQHRRGHGEAEAWHHEALSGETLRGHWRRCSLGCCCDPWMLEMPEPWDNQAHAAGAGRGAAGLSLPNKLCVLKMAELPRRDYSVHRGLEDHEQVPNVRHYLHC